MNKNTKARLTTVAAGAALLAVFGGGSAVAGGLITSAQIQDNTIRSADLQTGSVRSVDVRDNSVGTVDLRNGSVRGVDIADGSLTNQDVNVLFASVDSTGVLENSSGNVLVNKTSTGFYTVDFGRDITRCAFTATAGGVGQGIEEGSVNVSDKTANAEAVYVWTQDAGSVSDDIDFHLVVVC